MADHEIKACDKCGWADHGRRFNPGQCDPERGASAKDLIAALPDVESTQLGYGFGQIVIGRNIDDHDFSIKLQVNERSFQWNGITCFKHDLSQDDAIDLVRTLLAWRDRCDKRKETKS